MNKMIDHIRDGLNANFPLCCITFFLIRNRIYLLTGHFLPSFHRSGHGQHVFCPFHMLMPVKDYYNCYNGSCHEIESKYLDGMDPKDIVWMQYAKNTCNKCGGKMKKRPPFREGVKIK